MAKATGMKGKTLQYQLTVRFISVLVVAVVVLSTAITALTIMSIYDSTKEQTKLLLTSLKKSPATSAADWQTLLATHIPNDNSPNFIRVALKSGEVVYSEEAEELYQDFASFKQVIFGRKLLWDQEFEPYYYQTLEVNSASISVLVEMEDSFAIIGQIISFTLALTLLVILVGGVVTYRFAERISRSLHQMNQEIMGLSQKTQETSWLTEPNDPIEVANISASFNHLIAKQRRMLGREKQFVSDASHELRTPLTAIRGHVNLIKRRGTEHPEIIPTSIAYLDKESKRMEILVEQLLTLGRQERGTEVVDLSRLVSETVAEFQVLQPERIDLTLQAGIELSGTREHFYQIIRNLLENALKYSDQEQRVTLVVSGDQVGMTLIVADTGIGIAAQDKKQIFERFYRADQSRSSMIAGSGIGLAIVKELVDRYEGTITVKDNQPKGTRFTLYLPFK